MSKYTFTREFYIPKDYELITKNELYGFEVWGTMHPRIVAAAFGGKRSKPDWHYRFASEERLKQKIDETLSGFVKSADFKAKLKAERNKPHDVKVGDIFRSCWGYDQTNIDYYQCTKVIGAMIEIREIAQQREDSGFMQGQCVPAPGAFISETMKKRVQVYAGNEPSLRITSYASATRIKPLAEIAGVKIYEKSEWTAYA